MKCFLGKRVFFGSLFVCLFFPLTIGASVRANGYLVAVPVSGCGTGCLIRQKQLGSPYMDKKGIRKVLVAQTFIYTTAAGSYGGSDWQETKRLYFLAQCTKRKAHFGSYSSNGMGEDDIFHWVDVPRGDEENRQFGPNWATYIQFDRICSLNLST